MLLFLKNFEAILHFAGEIKKHFDVRIEQNVTKFLGMVIEENLNEVSIIVHSRNMVDKMLDKFDMSACKPVSTSLSEGVHLSVRMSPQDERERDVMSRKPYR